MSLKITLNLGFYILMLLTFNGLSNGERVRYDNYRIYKVTPDNAKQLEVLQQLESTSDSLLFLDGVQAKQSSVVVAPHKIPDFLEILGNNEIQYELEEKNAQTLLDTADVQVQKRDGVYDRSNEIQLEGKVSKNFLGEVDVEVEKRDWVYDWSVYHNLEDTYEWLQSLARKYPNVVSLIEAGKTYQGRSILGVKISHKAGQPGIFLEAGIHAREWIAPATATYIIDKLLHSQDTAIRNIANNYDWYIFPHANPDGYVYTHTTNRMWRKTRRPYGSCYGADPNRNWNAHWNEVGSSSNPCSDTYAGPSAFSEIEVRSLADYIKSLKGKIQLYLSFHAYSQYLLYPFGYTSKKPSNVEDIKQVYSATLAAINKRYSTKYTGGNIYDAIYPASGSSIDWAYDNVDTKMSFCFELRPSSNAGGTGFLLPANQITPTGEETLDGIVAMIAKVNNLGYFKK